MDSVGVRTLALLVSACLLAGCGAGNLENPGADNTWSGPELTIQVPGHGTTVSTPSPRLFFRLRALPTEDDPQVWWSIDGGPWDRVPDPTTHVLQQTPLAGGTHLVRAYVGAADGTPVFSPGGVAASIFHVAWTDPATGQEIGGESNDFGARDAEGRWQPFDPHGPVLVVVPAAGKTHALVKGVRLDGKTWRVRATLAGEVVHLGSEYPLGGTLAGEATEVVLEHRASEDADWAPARGGSTSWTPAP